MTADEVMKLLPRPGCRVPLASVPLDDALAAELEARDCVRHGDDILRLPPL